MADLDYLELLHSDLPKYEYSQLKDIQDPDYVVRGEVALFPNISFEKSPDGIKTDRSIRELLDS